MVTEDIPPAVNDLIQLLENLAAARKNQPNSHSSDQSLKVAPQDSTCNGLIDHDPCTSPQPLDDDDDDDDDDDHQLHGNSSMEGEEDEDIATENLQGELVQLKTAHALSTINRKLALNKFFDLNGNINVFLRIRPPPPDEQPSVRPFLNILEDEFLEITNTDGKMKRTYQFDRIFGSSSSQDDVYLEVEQIVRSALDGNNVCIFAYGQTGTGKTFTMEGSNDDPGIIPRTFQRLFYEASTESSVKYTFTMSMLEVYRNSLRDLLVPHHAGVNGDHPHPTTKSLYIKMAGPTIEVENLTTTHLISANHANFLYNRASCERSTACTTANENSSRSHCLVRITITRTNFGDRNESTSCSKLWLVDLGGSERFAKTKSHGRTLEEGKYINVSLCALADVINALQTKQSHIPYRNSKLTQLLRDCLGTDSKALLLVHISGKKEDLGETLCSLEVSSRARGVQLGRELPEAAATQKAAMRADVLSKMKTFEAECQLLSEKIHALELIMTKKLQAVSFHEQEPQNTDKITASTSNFSHLKSRPLIRRKEIGERLCALPRFMTSTISSRYKTMLYLDNMDQHSLALKPCEAGKDQHKFQHNVLKHKTPIVRIRPPSPEAALNSEQGIKRLEMQGFQIRQERINALLQKGQNKVFIKVKNEHPQGTYALISAYERVARIKAS